MERGRERELRHDFRRYYGVSYDEVPTDEALDLIETLPDGTLYAAATDPLRSWSPERNRHADVMDALEIIVWALALDHKEVPEPRMTVRPRDRAIQARARERARNARVTLESGSWQEV